MATYKLIQDIEAEDHILGPLSLRQFIYAMLAVFLYYICFFLVTKGAAFMLIVFLPPALFFTFFAFPFGRDQSTEVWALAKLRFIIKPRKRTWDQSGLKELVTITVPKKIERILTNGLGQEEVKSRLSALANTLDSRGWAVKNVDADKFNYTDPFALQTSDRLVDISKFPIEVPAGDINDSDDIMDANSNPVAHQFEEMITDSEKAYRQQLIDRMNGRAALPTKHQSTPADNWFIGRQPQNSQPPSQAPVTAIDDTASTSLSTHSNGEENEIVVKLKAQNAGKQAATANLRTLQPVANSPQVQQLADNQPQPATPPQYDPAIINTLASNNDLNVATLARQANKDLHTDDGEVVISLH